MTGDYKAADSGRIIGARLFSGAFHALWQKSLADLYNTTIPLRQVFPDVNDAFIEKLLLQPDEVAVYRLAELIQSKKPLADRNIELVDEIISAIETDNLQDVKAVAQRFGKSERRLQQLFQEYVGIGIKWLLQRNRLIEAAVFIRDEDSPNWAALAFDLGYSSQQHFITDFKHVIGKTPIQYKKSLTNNP
ncbi:MAG TPA: AraC family transcriptional regulator [Candidatus Chromulinivoraceae bacterium]|nr:AraC family transcriptional regulator [Candidatus Chromulinivoraceae bacterium]